MTGGERDEEDLSTATAEDDGGGVGGVAEDAESSSGVSEEVSNVLTTPVKPGSKLSKLQKPRGTDHECQELSPVECHLETRELWEKFHDLGTEMIITKTGR